MLIDWTEYNADKATVDAIIMQTSSQKLRQRAIQENLDYEGLVALGISQEQATKKSGRLPETDKETVGRLKQQNKVLKEEIKKNKGQQGGKKCGRCSWKECPGGIKCASEGKQCYACGGKNHFANARDCQHKGKFLKKKNDGKDKTSSKIQEAEDSDSEDEMSSRILEKLVGKMENEKTETIFTEIKIKGDEEQDFGTRIQVATDTGVGNVSYLCFFYMMY